MAYRWRDHRRGLALPLLIATFAGCGATEGPPKRPPSEAVLEIPSATTTPAPAAPVPVEPPDAAEARSGSSDPAVFQCGSTTCPTGTHTCCGTGDKARCVQSEPDEDGPESRIERQFVACTSGARNEDFAQCDESIDCGPRRVCCEQLLVSGRHMTVCEPLRASRVSQCDYGELCQPGSKCRVLGTVCKQGRCVKPVAQLRCGDDQCSSTQSCCGSPPTCQPDADCPDRWARFACTRRADCVAGHQCVVSSQGSMCTAYLPETLLPGSADTFLAVTVACETAADCPANTCAGGVRAKCGAGSHSWIRECVCP
jgi:hypothetical protein